MSGGPGNEVRGATARTVAIPPVPRLLVFA
jgi:hypothetical protein